MTASFTPLVSASFQCFPAIGQIASVHFARADHGGQPPLYKINYEWLNAVGEGFTAEIAARRWTGAETAVHEEG